MRLTVTFSATLLALIAGADGAQADKQADKQNAIRQAPAVGSGLAPEAISVPASAPEKSAVKGEGPDPAQSEAKIQQRVQQMQRWARQKQAILEQQLKKAQALREQGFKQNNPKLIDQAEKLERRAFTDYNQFITNIDKYETYSQSSSSKKNPKTATNSNATRQNRKTSRLRDQTRSPSSSPNARQSRRGIFKRWFAR